jgi:hypothetical protein
VLSLVTEDVAQEHGHLPGHSKIGNFLTVAVSDPVRRPQATITCAIVYAQLRSAPVVTRPMRQLKAAIKKAYCGAATRKRPT